MAHFTYVRASGMWTVSVLLASEMATFDAHQYAAINGDAGGTWAPSSIIYIGGQGITLTGQLTCAAASAVTFTAGAGVFNCGKLATLTGGLVVNSDTTLGANSSNTLTVNATTAWNGDVSFNHDVEIGNSPSDSLRITATVVGDPDTNTVLFSDSIQTTADLIAAGDAILGTGLTDATICEGSLTAFGFSQFKGNCTIGLTSAQTLTVNSTTTFASPVTFAATNHNGTAGFNGGILTYGLNHFGSAPGGESTFGASVTLTSSADLTANGDVTLGASSSNALDVNATSTFAAPVTISAALQAASIHTISSTVVSQFNGPATFDRAVSFPLDSAILNSDITLVPADNVWKTFCCFLSLDTNHLVSLSPTGAVVGQFVVITNGSAANDILVRDNATGIATLTPLTGALFVFNGSHWYRAI